MKKMQYVFLVILMLLIAPMFTLAQTDPESRGDSKQSSATKEELELSGKAVGDVLIVFFVLSVVFEVAMTPIFNWRVFLKHAEGKGWKTPIVIISAFLVFWGYNLDIISELLIALGQETKIDHGGQLLTALLIAGGSDGVFRIFTKLGIRNPEERKEKAEIARTEAPQGDD
jgi:hypothetical protein